MKLHIIPSILATLAVMTVPCWSLVAAEEEGMPADAEAAKEAGMAKGGEAREATGRPDLEKLESKAVGKDRVAREEAKHLKRMAKIERIEAIAQEKGNDQLLETVARLREKEAARHERAMTRIAGKGRGGKPDEAGGGKPEEAGGGKPEGVGGGKDAKEAEKAQRGGRPEGAGKDTGQEHGKAKGGRPE